MSGLRAAHLRFQVSRWFSTEQRAEFLFGQSDQLSDRPCLGIRQPKRDDLVHQTGVRIEDDEADTGQAAIVQLREELAPERLVLTVTDIEAEDLAMPVSPESGAITTALETT